MSLPMTLKLNLAQAENNLRIAEDKLARVLDRSPDNHGVIKSWENEVKRCEMRVDILKNHGGPA